MENSIGEIWNRKLKEGKTTRVHVGRKKNISARKQKEDQEKNAWQTTGKRYHVQRDGPASNGQKGQKFREDSSAGSKAVKQRNGNQQREEKPGFTSAVRRLGQKGR